MSEEKEEEKKPKEPTKKTASIYGQVQSVVVLRSNCQDRNLLLALLTFTISSSCCICTRPVVLVKKSGLSKWGRLDYACKTIMKKKPILKELKKEQHISGFSLHILIGLSLSLTALLSGSGSHWPGFSFNPWLAKPLIALSPECLIGRVSARLSVICPWLCFKQLGHFLYAAAALETGWKRACVCVQADLLEWHHEVG